MDPCPAMSNSGLVVDDVILHTTKQQLKSTHHYTGVPRGKVKGGGVVKTKPH